MRPPQTRADSDTCARVSFAALTLLGMVVSYTARASQPRWPTSACRALVQPVSIVHVSGSVDGTPRNSWSATHHHQRPVRLQSMTRWSGAAVALTQLHGLEKAEARSAPRPATASSRTARRTSTCNKASPRHGLRRCIVTLEQEKAILAVRLRMHRHSSATEKGDLGAHERSPPARPPPSEAWSASPNGCGAM